MVRLLLRYYVTLGLEGGWLTPLEAAIKHKLYSVAELLLQEGANANHECGVAGTPLCRSIHWDRADFMKLLLQSGGDINAQSSQGDNVLS